MTWHQLSELIYTRRRPPEGGTTNKPSHHGFVVPASAGALPDHRKMAARRRAAAVHGCDLVDTAAASLQGVELLTGLLELHLNFGGRFFAPTDDLRKPLSDRGVGRGGSTRREMRYDGSRPALQFNDSREIVHPHARGLLIGEIFKRLHETRTFVMR